MAGTPGGPLSSVRSPVSFDKVAEIREPVAQMKELSVADVHAYERDAEVAPSPHSFPGYSAEHHASFSKAHVAESVGSFDTRSEILERDNTIAEQRETIQVQSSPIK